MVKKTFLFFILFYLIFGITGCKHFQIQSISYVDGTYKLMSYNIKTYTPKDIEVKNEYWHNRKSYIIQQIEREAPDFLCLQEVKTNQYDDLIRSLNSYQSVYFHRELDSLNPEGLAIFYRSDRFDAREIKRFWLSDTPDIASIGWNSFYERFCILMTFTEKTTHQSFAICNVHLDYAKGDTQKKSLDIIYEQLGDTPSFILGDFNFQENSNDYHYARQLFLDAKWEALITEDVPTFNNYGQATRITTCDYTFIKNSCFLINSYQVLDETFDGLYASDHYAIVIVAHLM